MDIICYRCGGGENPENTMIGIEHCQRVQPDWPIEMDLQMSQDGQIVLFHDANTKRITGDDRQISELTLNEIQQLNAGFHFERNREFVYRDSPLAIPTLNEVVNAYPNVQCILDIHTFDLDAVPIIIDIVETNGLGQNVVIVSGSDAIISSFKQMQPTWRYAAATTEAKRLIYSSFLCLDRFFPLRSDYLMIPLYHGNTQVLTSRVSRHVRKQGKQLWAWMKEADQVRTVETKAEVEQLQALGTNAVFTDFPEKLKLELS